MGKGWLILRYVASSILCGNVCLKKSTVSMTSGMAKLWENVHFRGTTGGCFGDMPFFGTPFLSLEVFVLENNEQTIRSVITAVLIVHSCVGLL